MELTPDFYWQIELWNGDKIPVRPQNAELIQNKISQGEGFIKTKTLTINVKDIKGFNQTDQIYTDKKLLRDVARAFDKPETFERDSGHGYKEEVVEAAWVKKIVPRRKWDAYYRFGNYKLLHEDESRAIIAFRLPVHQINPDSVTEMTAEEVRGAHL